MDTNLFAILVICGIYGSWRFIEYRRARSRKETMRARVAWMLWLAANHIKQDQQFTPVDEVQPERCF